MRDLTRRAFSASLAAAQTPIELPQWNSAAHSGDAFELPGPPSPRVRWNVVGTARKHFSEWLPALFTRTIELDQASSDAALRWVFTGPSGGFTVEAGAGKATLTTRYYDSPGLSGKAKTRHPEAVAEEAHVTYKGELRAITVECDHRLTFRLKLNGVEMISSRAPLDVNQHQLVWVAGALKGRVVAPEAETCTVTVDASSRHQTMLGFGGITTPAAYRQLSERGREKWWRIVAEYNLLLQREYPIGALLRPEMDNWDRLSDAAPHYYGDNFPNSEITDFEYLRRIRQLGGKVIFEFWDLPLWARRRDGAGKLTDAPDIARYVKAMVRYCEVARTKSGAPPEIVGIQNEVKQSAEDWRAMTVALRRGLDQAGFKAVKIHMHNASTLGGGLAAAPAFRGDADVWRATDYAASNMYDYQNHFHDPDAFDARIQALKEATAGKPFLAVELCINANQFQTRAYRVAFAMAQLYHKLLTQIDAAALVYCWTLLNIVQPSYGWTRTLMVPDPEHGFVPAATSHQLRLFGAYSRHVKEGMQRVGAASSNPNVLPVAFTGPKGERTLILLNRSLKPQRMTIQWPGAAFRVLETASPQQENEASPAPREIVIAPGAVVTLVSGVVRRG